MAQRVLDDPNAILYSTLANLAARAEVSEPTVVRFCRSMGCDGFQHFKVRLAQDLAHHFPYADLQVTPEMSVDDYGTKVFDATLNTLFALRANLDREATAKAVDVLREARTIEFYGMGASGTVAMDAYHKFFRFPTPCAVHTDSHMQVMAAARLSERDVVVAISHTGRSRDLIESVTAARDAEATVISITRAGTPLATSSDILLAVNAPEDTDLYTPMTSRIAHLAVIDVLALGVALAGEDGTADRLRRIKTGLRNKRMPRNEGE